MEYWDISVDMMLKFRTEDIPQIRITLANDLYFSEKNTEDKSLVHNMFLQVFLFNFVLFFWALLLFCFSSFFLFSRVVRAVLMVVWSFLFLCIIFLVWFAFLYQNIDPRIVN